MTMAACLSVWCSETFDCRVLEDQMMWDEFDDSSVGASELYVARVAVVDQWEV